MKWGIRRFRNKDGSYTTAGKARYGKKRTRRPSHDRLIASRDADEIYKYRKYYTDQELQGRLNRLNTEENLYRKTTKAKRKQAINNFARKAIKTVAVAGPAAYTAYNIYKNYKYPDRQIDNTKWYNKEDKEGHNFKYYMFTAFQKAAGGGKKK